MPRRRAKKKIGEKMIRPGKIPKGPLKIKESGAEKAYPIAPVRRIGGPISEGRAPGPSTISLGIILRNMIFGKHVKKPGKKRKL